MYSNEVVIAVNNKHDAMIESCIRFASKYQKNIAGGNSYFHIPDIQWEENYMPQVDQIIGTLNTLGTENYAFVRIGDDINDIEAHGSIKNFGITITRSINY